MARRSRPRSAGQIGPDRSNKSSISCGGCRSQRAADARSSSSSGSAITLFCNALLTDRRVQRQEAWTSHNRVMLVATVYTAAGGQSHDGSSMSSLLTSRQALSPRRRPLGRDRYARRPGRSPDRHGNAPRSPDDPVCAPGLRDCRCGGLLPTQVLRVPLSGTRSVVACCRMAPRPGTVALTRAEK